MLLLIRHTFEHLGPELIAVALIVYIAWRSGQLGNADRARHLPLLVAPLPEEPETPPSRGPWASFRRTMLLLSLAVIFGISIGIPVATTIVALKSDPGATQIFGDHNH